MCVYTYNLTFVSLFFNIMFDIYISPAVAGFVETELTFSESPDTRRIEVRVLKGTITFLQGTITVQPGTAGTYVFTSHHNSCELYSHTYSLQ